METPPSHRQSALRALAGRCSCRARRVALAGSLAVSLGASVADAGPGPPTAAAPPPVQAQLDSRYQRDDNALVIIRDDALQPERVVLEPGQLVAWISYARSPSTIVFARETARAMVCHSLVRFSIVGDELRSAPIAPGEFASFCELRPGRYPYAVLRSGSAAAGGAKRLEGVVVVEGDEGRSP